MTTNIAEIEAAVASTAMKSLENPDEQLQMPPISHDEEVLNHLIMDRLHAINKYETVHQTTTFPRSEFFNILMIVGDALLKRC